jgi:hypothetical protein
VVAPEGAYEAAPLLTSQMGQARGIEQGIGKASLQIYTGMAAMEIDGNRTWESPDDAFSSCIWKRKQCLRASKVFDHIIFCFLPHNTSHMPALLRNISELASNC